jgi:hypothetical protein
MGKKYAQIHVLRLLYEPRKLCYIVTFFNYSRFLAICSENTYILHVGSSGGGLL